MVASSPIFGERQGETLEEKVRAVAERVAHSEGLEVAEVELRGGGKSRMLRITIDKREGVTHGDCETVSRQVSAILDVEDIVPGGQYLLEVSSPGLDRRLVKAADFERFSGNLVRVRTREAISGSRNFEGRLRGLTAEKITLESVPEPARREARVKGSAPGRKREAVEAAAAVKVEIELANVETARLVPEF